MKKRFSFIRSRIFYTFLFSAFFYQTASHASELEQVQNLLSALKGKLTHLLQSIHNLADPSVAKLIEDKKKTTEALNDFISSPTDENLKKIEKAAKDYISKEETSIDFKKLQDERIKETKLKHKNGTQAFDDNQNIMKGQLNIQTKQAATQGVSFETVIKNLFNVYGGKDNFKEFLLILNNQQLAVLEEIVNDQSDKDIKDYYNAEKKARDEIDQSVTETKNNQDKNNQIALNSLSNAKTKMQNEKLPNEFFNALPFISIKSFSEWLKTLELPSLNDTKSLFEKLLLKENSQKIHEVLKDNVGKASAILSAILQEKNKTEQKIKEAEAEEDKLTQLAKELNKIVNKIITRVR